MTMHALEREVEIRKGTRVRVEGPHTLNGARIEAEFILLGDASHWPVTELAHPSGDAAVAAGGGTRDVDTRS